MTKRDPSKRINRKYEKDEGDRVLEQLAEETGGRAFFPYRVDDLGQSFLDIGDELRHQYALAYSPGGRTPDGKFHTIRIQVDRKDVIVRARKGILFRSDAAVFSASGRAFEALTLITRWVRSSRGG